MKVKLVIMLVSFFVVSSVKKSSAVKLSLSPGLSAPTPSFHCKTVILGEDEGGRKKPFKSGYRPQFYFRTTDVTGSITLLGDRKMVLPGDMDVDMEV
jgi:elongation factor Tu